MVAALVFFACEPSELLLLSSGNGNSLLLLVERSTIELWANDIEAQRGIGLGHQPNARLTVLIFSEHLVDLELSPGRVPDVPREVQARFVEPLETYEVNFDDGRFVSSARLDSLPPDRRALIRLPPARVPACEWTSQAFPIPLARSSDVLVKISDALVLVGGPGGFFTFDGQALRPVEEVPAGLPGGRAISDGQGGIWFVSELGLWRGTFDGVRLRASAVSLGGPFGLEVFSLAVDGDNLYMLDEAGGFWRYESTPDRWTLLYRFPPAIYVNRNEGDVVVEAPGRVAAVRASADDVVRTEGSTLTHARIGLDGLLPTAAGLVPGVGLVIGDSGGGVSLPVGQATWRRRTIPGFGNRVRGFARWGDSIAILAGLGLIGRYIPTGDILCPMVRHSADSLRAGVAFGDGVIVVGNAVDAPGLTSLTWVRPIPK
ncbi:MAG: hypothetical protein IT384_18455 [Deltaproteobacteria bacterium]|nr:hypothetical protein [Deltaproteobacteria bacterium]